MAVTDLQIDTAIPVSNTGTEADCPSRPLTRQLFKDLRDMAEEAGESGPVSSVAGKTGVVTLEIEDVNGLRGSLDGKLNAEDYNVLYVGTYVDLEDLELSHPTGESGQYAVIDPGTSTPPRKYLWDANTNEWAPGSDAAPTSTDDLVEGSTNLYFTGDRVRSAVLTGLSAPAAPAGQTSPISSLQTLISALGGLQGQINRLVNYDVAASGTYTEARADMYILVSGTTGSLTVNFSSIQNLGIGESVFVSAHTSSIEATSGTVKVAASGSNSYLDGVLNGELIVPSMFTVKVTRVPNLDTVSRHFVTEIIPPGGLGSCISISENLTLTNAYHGQKLQVTAEATITVPSGLRQDFEVHILRDTSAAFSVVAGSGVTLKGVGNTGNYTCDEGAWIALVKLASGENYSVIGGELVP